MRRGIPALSTDEIHEIGRDYRRGYFFHNNLHDVLAGECRKCQLTEDSDVVRWNFLFWIYSRLMNNKTILAKSIRALFTSKFAQKLIVKGHTPQHLSACMIEMLSVIIGAAPVLDDLPPAFHLAVTSVKTLNLNGNLLLVAKVLYPDRPLPADVISHELNLSVDNQQRQIGASNPFILNYADKEYTSSSLPGAPLFYEPISSSKLKNPDEYNVATLFLIGIEILEVLRVYSYIRADIRTNLTYYKPMLLDLAKYFINVLLGKEAQLAENYLSALALWIERFVSSQVIPAQGRQPMQRVENSDVIPTLMGIMQHSPFIPFAILVFVTARLNRQRGERHNVRNMEEAVAWVLKNLGVPDNHKMADNLSAMVWRLNQADEVVAQRVRQELVVN